MKKTTTLILTHTFYLLVISLTIFYFGFPWDSVWNGENLDHRQTNSEYRFVSPLLECISSPYYITGAVRELEKQLQNEVAVYKNREKKENTVGHISIYYRDLSNGPWFGIDEDEGFLPASLAKMPLMISILKLAERDPSLLEKKVVYNSSQSDIFQHFVPQVRLEAGKNYSVKELLHQMIAFSDNDALDSLFSSPLIDTGIFDDVYHDFGIEAPKDANATIDVKTYASFFRVLYNGTYLTPDLSEFALETLSQSAFTQGLRAGVPDSVPIAHKFGERTDPSTGDHQLHDCGVVYVPTRPYVLCVMTRGDDFGEMASVIAEISKHTYQMVAHQ